MIGADGGPFAFRLLHAIFAESSDSGGDCGAHTRFPLCFRHADNDRPPCSPGLLQCAVEPRIDRSEIGGDIIALMETVWHDGLRTRSAKLAAAGRALKRASGATAPFCLAFLTDRTRIPEPEPILGALPAGAAVIFRDYDAPRRAAIARRYLAICRARGVLFLVAGDRDLAAAIGADGVHWPGRLLAAAARGNRSENLIVTAACHGAEDLARAHHLGAGLALLSPVFPTPSHAGAPALGRARFRALAAASPLPVLALGGVDAANARLLAGANVAGLAAIGAFAAAPAHFPDQSASGARHK